jgi:hypothetical protein
MMQMDNQQNTCTTKPRAKPKNSVIKCEQALRVQHREVARYRRRAMRAEGLFEAQRSAYINMLRQPQQNSKETADFLFHILSEHGRAFTASLGPGINARIAQIRTPHEYEQQIRQNATHLESEKDVKLQVSKLILLQKETLMNAWKEDMHLQSWEHADEVLEKQQTLAFLWQADLHLAKEWLPLLAAEDKTRVSELIAHCEKPGMILHAQICFLETFQNSIF